MELEDKLKVEGAEAGAFSVEDHDEETVVNSGEKISAPKFGIPSEMAEDKSIRQVEDLDLLDKDLAVENETPIAVIENAPVVDPKVVEKRMLEMLNGNESLPIGGKMGSAYDEMLGVSADHVSNSEVN